MNAAEVALHNNSDSLWMIIHGNVYDLTKFADSHPGGKKVLLRWAGKDATEEYDPIHPSGTIESLDKECHLGPVDVSTLEKVIVKEIVKVEGATIPTLEGCLNLRDFEIAARILLKPKGYAYYASAADTERTKDWNNEAYDLIKFRPRVLRDVEVADQSVSILGTKCSSPFFISPAAMGRLAHPDGEKCLAKAAALSGGIIPYIVSANSSVGFQELVLPDSPDQLLFYQLYVNKDRSKTEAILRQVAKAGYKAICVTVDTPVSGKRERDERTTMDSDSAADESMRANVVAKQGIAQSLGSYVDASLSWNDLEWIKKTSGLKLILKGIQTAEDAALAAYYKADAIILSNHGGRQLDGAPSAIETLQEIRLREPHVFKKLEVYVDGGIQRGTDVLKALCLGATAVGIGRPFMYSLVFGDEGPQKVVDILKQEIAQNIRLLGCTNISQLNPSYVNTRLLDARLDLSYKNKELWWWSKL